MEGLYPRGSIIKRHLKARNKCESESMSPTGKMNQNFDFCKAMVNLSHSCGGIWCKLHQINKMPMKKKKAIFKNLLIGNAVKQFSAIYNQMSTNEGGIGYLLVFFVVS